MGILDRLRGASGTQRFTVRDVSGMSCREVPIVGESRHQDSLETIGGGRGDDGLMAPQQWALLVREPDNPADANAVAVYLRHGEGAAVAVGYLARPSAAAYAPRLDRMAPTTVLCHAELRGGWDRPPAKGGVVTMDASGRRIGKHGDHSRCDRGNIGVVLYLPDPTDLS